MGCKSWTGDYDDQDNPIKNGKLYLPGVRICGFRDCVNVIHIIGASVANGHKRCSVCSSIKPNSAFGIDRKKRDGLNCECKQCRSLRKKPHKVRVLE